MTENRIPFEADAKRKKNQICLKIKGEHTSEMMVSDMILSEIVGKGKISGQIFEADCISTCAWLASKKRKVDLVYIDPPFGSGGDYTSNVYLRGKPKKDDSFEVLRYTDKRKDEDYLVWLSEQLRAIRTVMSEEASIYIHLDWHICHYVKVLMDEIFGADNFINEIIWSYKSGGASKGSFAKKHDTIYLYAKNKGKHIFNPQQEKSYNREYKPYRFKGVKEYEDEKGWYTLVNMKDVWEIDMVGRTARERVDYATQKPIAMLERMIKSSSNPNDLVADFFGGSGVCAEAAVKLGRNFIHADLNPDSIFTTRDRLLRSNCVFEILKKESNQNESAIEMEIELVKNSESWSVVIKKYYSEKISQSVRSWNDSKMNKIELSEKGLELIEAVSLDCDRHDGVWYSSEEIHINKQGNIIQNNIEVKMFWDGSIKSKLKPLRVKIRNIIGEEKIHLL